MIEFLTYIKIALKSRSIYITTAIVGTLINIYGQFLVPILRGYESAVQTFIKEFANDPFLVLLSIMLAYLFPFCVSTITTVITRYKDRVFESQALFPALKPDPVFRAKLDGTITLAGGRTQEFLDENNITNAINLLGQDTWDRIVKCSEDELEVYLPSKDRYYLVVYAHTDDGDINVYMTTRKVKR